MMFNEVGGAWWCGCSSSIKREKALWMVSAPWIYFHPLINAFLVECLFFPSLCCWGALVRLISKMHLLTESAAGWGSSYANSISKAEVEFHCSIFRCQNISANLRYFNYPVWRPRILSRFMNLAKNTLKKKWVRESFKKLFLSLDIAANID